MTIFLMRIYYSNTRWYYVRRLIKESGVEAEQLAQKLCDTNIERQKIEREIYEEALNRITELHIENDKVLVIDGKNWHPGVIGIVASRILELYHRPVLVLTIRNGVGKGSCRSIPAFNMYEALGVQADLLIQYGGHKMAAGFSIDEDKISLFRKKINMYAEEILTPRYELLTPIRDDDIIPESVKRQFL